MIESVDWTHRGEYIQTRSRRRPGDVDIQPEWATEAVFDEERLIGLDPASKSGWGIRVVGKSLQANRVLAVILIPKDVPGSMTPEPVELDGNWWGANAWVASTKYERRYNAHESWEV